MHGMRRNGMRLFLGTLTLLAAAGCAAAFILFRPAGIHPLLCMEAAVSLVLCGLHVLDKMAAKAGMWRVPEKMLLGLTVLSGGIAAFGVRQLIRHKTAREHRYFAVVEGVSFILHTVLWLNMDRIFP